MKFRRPSDGSSPLIACLSYERYEIGYKLSNSPLDSSPRNETIGFAPMAEEGKEPRGSGQRKIYWYHYERRDTAGRTQVSESRACGNRAAHIGHFGGDDPVQGPHHHDKSHGAVFDGCVNGLLAHVDLHAREHLRCVAGWRARSALRGQAHVDHRMWHRHRGFPHRSRVRYESHAHRIACRRGCGPHHPHDVWPHHRSAEREPGQGGNVYGHMGHMGLPGVNRRGGAHPDRFRHVGLRRSMDCICRRHGSGCRARARLHPQASADARCRGGARRGDAACSETTLS